MENYNYKNRIKNDMQSALKYIKLSIILFAGSPSLIQKMQHQSQYQYIKIYWYNKNTFMSITNPVGVRYSKKDTYSDSHKYVPF